VSLRGRRAAEAIPQMTTEPPSPHPDHPASRLKPRLGPFDYAPDRVARRRGYWRSAQGTAGEPALVREEIPSLHSE
jgi:hypothetical protein